MKPTGNVILQAIRKYLISQGIHPTRVVYVPTTQTLTIRYSQPPFGPRFAKTSVRLATIRHDGIKISLVHDGMLGPDNPIVLPLADPDVLDKVLNILSDFVVRANYE